MKNALYTPADYARTREFIKEDEALQRPKMAEIYLQYWERCRIAGAMDFDDLLFYTNILFRDHPDVLKQYQEFFKTVLIDEYQDTNFAQDNIVYQLAKITNPYSLWVTTHKASTRSVARISIIFFHSLKDTQTEDIPT